MAAGVVVHDRIVIDIAVPVPGLGLIWIRHDRIRLQKASSRHVIPASVVKIDSKCALINLPGVLAAGQGGVAVAVARFTKRIVTQFERPALD